MKIVIDTNVVISGTFFGGYPRMIIDAVLDEKLTASATAEIVDEYMEIAHEMITRKQGHFRETLLAAFIGKMELIESHSVIHISRDADDDKFISCAKDSQALYIVSGDKDLLVLEHYDNIQIMTAKEFCEKELCDYTEWRENHLDNSLNVRELSKKAMEFQKKNN